MIGTGVEMLIIRGSALRLFDGAQGRQAQGERKFPLSPPLQKGDIGGFALHVIRPICHEQLALSLSNP
jgi:hypothetical protein